MVKYRFSLHIFSQIIKKKIIYERVQASPIFIKKINVNCDELIWYNTNTKTNN